MEGNDIGCIDVGFLVRGTIAVDSVTQIEPDAELSLDGSLLNDRPPLELRGSYTGNGGAFPLAVIAVHQRSLSGIEGRAPPPTASARSATSRRSCLARAHPALQDLRAGPAPRGRWATSTPSSSPTATST